MAKEIIPIFNNITKPLSLLEKVFSRRRTYHWFCTAVFAMLFGYGREGTIQADLNTLNLKPKQYHNMLHFYNSRAYKLSELVTAWRQTAKKLYPFFRFNGRCVIVGDSTKKSKEGRRMMAVKRLHSHSDTQSKSSSFHGIHAGALVLLASGIANPSEIHSIPLEISIMEGLDPLADWKDTPKPYAKESVEIQEIIRLEEIVNDYGDCYYVTDRASMAQGAFERIAAMNKTTGFKVDMITNAKKDCVCYLDSEYSGKGRIPKRGKAFKLFSLFETKKKDFIRTTLKLYGRDENIKYYSAVFHWGKDWNGKLLFVLCHSSKGNIALACTDLTLDPKSVITLYSLRFGSIEEDFKWYKGGFSGMSFQFWSSVHPHLSHFRKKEDGHILENITSPETKKKLLSLLNREEVYMQVIFIAFGIVKFIAMNEDVGGIIQMAKPKRTYTTSKVSTSDVQYFLQNNKNEFFKKYKDHEIVSFIREKIAKKKNHLKYL